MRRLSGEVTTWWRYVEHQIYECYDCGYKAEFPKPPARNTVRSTEHRLLHKLVTGATI